MPDLPLDELDGWGSAADAAGIETVLLAGPTTDDERLARICERTRGFVYGVALMGVTGEREQLADQAKVMGQRCKAATDKPVLLGLGISNPAQAAEAAEAADGVIVGQRAGAPAARRRRPGRGGRVRRVAAGRARRARLTDEEAHEEHDGRRRHHPDGRARDRRRTDGSASRPDRRRRATRAMIVVQEAFGVNRYIERVTERFAAAGFDAVAPSFFHRAGGGTASVRRLRAR